MRLVEAQKIFRSYKRWNKCFCIGTNKTGTSTLQAVMETVLGYRANQGEVEEYAGIQTMYGNFSPLKEIMKEYDFHKDNPASQGMTYVGLDVMFPNSKFILTKREPLEWAKSFATHYSEYIRLAIGGETKGINDGYNLFKGYGEKWIKYYWGEELEKIKLIIGEKVNNQLELIKVLQDKEVTEILAKSFAKRNRGIKEYFKYRKEALYEIDISKEKNISGLTSFLELPDIVECDWPKITPIKGKKINTESMSISIKLKEMDVI